MSKDRRERKSRAAFKNALIQLMAEKSAEKISVTEICSLADVNRSTFYAHYGSVEQLLSDIHKDLFADMDRFLGLSDIHTQVPPKRTNSQILAEVLNYMCGERFRFFLDNNASHLLEHNLCRYYTEKYCKDDAPLERRYALFYHTIGCFSLIQLWIADGCPCSSDCLAQQLIRLSSSGELF